MISTIPCSLKILSESLPIFYSGDFQSELCKTLIEVLEKYYLNRKIIKKCLGPTALTSGLFYIAATADTPLHLRSNFV